MKLNSGLVCNGEQWLEASGDNWFGCLEAHGVSWDDS